MPIYEYQCRSCHHRFEELVRAGAEPACPECKSRKLEKLLSAFAVGSETPTAADTPCGEMCGTCADAGGCMLRSDCS